MNWFDDLKLAAGGAVGFATAGVVAYIDGGLNPAAAILAAFLAFVFVAGLRYAVHRRGGASA